MCPHRPPRPPACLSSSVYRLSTQMRQTCVLHDGPSCPIVFLTQRILPMYLPSARSPIPRPQHRSLHECVSVLFPLFFDSPSSPLSSSPGIHTSLNGKWSRRHGRSSLHTQTHARVARENSVALAGAVSSVAYCGIFAECAESFCSPTAIPCRMHRISFDLRS